MHNIAVCKNGGKWYEFNDEEVMEKTEEDIVDDKAYLLFYECEMQM